MPKATRCSATRSRSRKSQIPSPCMRSTRGSCRSWSEGPGRPRNGCFPGVCAQPGRRERRTTCATAGSQASSNDYLVVTRVGSDSNASVGLTGGTGAAQIWARVLRSLEATGVQPAAARGRGDRLDRLQHGARDPRAVPEEAVYLALPSRDVPPTAVDCGSSRTRVASRLRQWLKNRLTDGVL